MKKLCWVLAGTFLALFLIFIALLFSLSDIQTLKPEEQLRIKEDKFFWKWNSPYGTFNMHYIEKGKSSKHILLLHGFRAHTFTWRHLINPLEMAGYHVWAIDLIGYGLSDKPENALYNVDFFVQQVEAFMEAKGIFNAHLIGSSMGGGLALNIALSHPQRVSSLSLLNALGYPLDFPFHLSICRYINQIWTPFLGPRMVRYALKQIVFDQTMISDEQVAAYCLPYRFPGGIAASLLTLQQFDNRHLAKMGQSYSSLNNPMLIIWGRHDSLIPISHFEKFVNDFPNAKCLLIPDCGHIPQEEAPQEVLKIILEFLQNITH